MAALLLALFVAATAMSATDRQSRAVALPAGRSLTLEIAVGAVRIEGWDRDDAQLVIERRAPSTAALDRLPVVVDESPERVSVRILMDRRDDVLKVERGGFYEAGGGATAYVVKGDVAERRSITTGAVSVREIEITGGLAEGEQVVISDTEDFRNVPRVMLAD